MLSILAGWAIVGILLLAPSSFVIMLLWNWFITPLGAPAIGFWHAVGLDCVATMFGTVPIYPDTDNMSMREQLDFFVSRIKTVWGVIILSAVVGFLAQHMMR